jgi:phosphate transport system protein
MADLVYVKDDAIDELELEIENACMTLIALQQPMAKDLRTISTALKVITDLERMGDNAVNIANVTKEIGNQPLIKPLIDIPRMAKLTQYMVRRSLDAFVNEDIDLAAQVSRDDDAVDKIYEEIYLEIIDLMRKDPKTIFQGTRLLFVGRYLERIADHTTNVCERIIYMVTGRRIEIN